MVWQWNPTIWLVIAVWLTCAAMGALAWRRRHLRSHRVGLVTAVLTCLWATAYALQLASAELIQAYTFMCWAILVPAGLPLFWFIVAYRLSYPHTRLLAGAGVLLAIVPAVSMWLLACPGLGGPMAVSGQMLNVDRIQVLKITPGPFFRVYLVYILSLMCVTIVMLAVRARHLAPAPRRKAWIMLSAVIILMLVTGLYSAGWIQWRRFHPSSLTSLLTQVVFLWGILTTPLIDVRPIAREQVIEAMRDGLIVFDMERRVVDISPAAVAMLGVSGNQVLGETSERALVRWPELALVCDELGARTVELELTPDSLTATARWIEARIQPLAERGGHQVGYIAMLRDITERKLAELDREHLVQELRGALAEVKTLQGLLPVCAWCGKIRDDDGTWSPLDTYVETHYDASVTHGICPDCAARFAAEGNALVGGGPKES